jgi:hypothetical protein
MSEMTKQVDILSGEVTELPAGWVKADTDFDGYPSWDWTLGVCEGEVLKVGRAEFDDADRQRSARYLVVAEKGGTTVRLWERANLSRFFDEVKAGYLIRVKETGVKELGKGRKMILHEAEFQAGA